MSPHVLRPARPLAWHQFQLHLVWNGDIYLTCIDQVAQIGEQEIIISALSLFWRHWSTFIVTLSHYCCHLLLLGHSENWNLRNLISSSKGSYWSHWPLVTLVSSSLSFSSPAGSTREICRCTAHWRGLHEGSLDMSSSAGSMIREMHWALT